MMNSQVVFPKTSSLVVFPSPKAAELSLGICSKGHVTQHLPGSPPRRRHLVGGENLVIFLAENIPRMVIFHSYVSGKPGNLMIHVVFPEIWVMRLCKIILQPG